MKNQNHTHIKSEKTTTLYTVNSTFERTGKQGFM